MSDIIAEGALALSRRIAKRDVSARELMAETYDRIAARDPAHNAVPTLIDRDAALALAASADEETARGLSRGWLHGIPQLVKDLSTTKGIRTTWGSPIFAEFIPTEDAIHVARAKAAGALVVGKTNTPEWGLGSHSYNPVFGVTRNAHDATLSAGGSSGGAAVALAIGILAVADGSDMGGSLRNPAGWNGVIGFRPSFGRVPASAPDDAFSNTLSTDGPMGTRVADVAALFATQTGYDPRAPLSLPAEAGLDRVAEVAVKGLRVGWLGDLGGHLPMEDGVIAVCEAALRRFEAAGAIVTPVALPFPPERLWSAWITLRASMVGGKLRPHYENPARRALLKPEAVWEIEGGLALSAYEVTKANMGRTAFVRAIEGLFADGIDVLAQPTAQCFAFPAEWTWPKEIAGRTMDTYHRWMEVVIGPTMAGAPVIAMPAGADSRGRRMGVQLWGPARADKRVLEIAAAWERTAAA
jgi:amidase